MVVKFEDVKVGDQYALNELGAEAAYQPEGTVVNVTQVYTGGKRAFVATLEDGTLVGTLYFDEVDEVVTAVDAQAALADWEKVLLEGVDLSDAFQTEPTEGDYEHYQGAEEDVVNHPSHYKSGGLEAIDVLEQFGLVRDGRLFNVGKYILRAGKKDDELQDLKKAQWYLNRLIESLEKSGD